MANTLRVRGSEHAQCAPDRERDRTVRTFESVCDECSPVRSPVPSAVAMSAFSKSFDATLALASCQQINHPGRSCLWFLGRNMRSVMPGCLQYFLPLILVMCCE